jgi:hypothetical protein
MEKFSEEWSSTVRFDRQTAEGMLNIMNNKLKTFFNINPPYNTLVIKG